MSSLCFKTNIFAEDPKKMFTDSSFYNSKYHPTIADQVEMAHKLSSAMFNEQNKGTKGAKMYLTRMENSGELLTCLHCLVIIQCLVSILNYTPSNWTERIKYLGHCLGKWIHRSENFDDG